MLHGLVAATCLMFVGCGKTDGDACTTWQDCDSGICGGGICVGGECPCDDGWTCAKINCGFLGCNEVCRQPCETVDDCPSGYSCSREDLDREETYCRYYVPPQIDLAPVELSGMDGMLLTVTATVELPERFTISDESMFTFSSNGRIERIGSPRIDGPTYSTDVIFWNGPGSGRVELAIVDEASAEHRNDKYRTFAEAEVRLELTCATAGSPCKGACCTGLECLADDGSPVYSDRVDPGACRPAP